MVVTDDFQRGVDSLRAVDRSQLTEEDLVLIDAALAVAEQVRRLPDRPDTGSAPPPALISGAEGGQGAGTAAGHVMERAQKTIAQVDQILSGTQQ
jgi:hypothetical protein